MGRSSVWAKGMALSMECEVVAEVGKYLEGKTQDLLFRVQCIWGGRNGARCALCSGCRDRRLSDFSGALSGFLMGGDWVDSGMSRA